MKRTILALCAATAIAAAASSASASTIVYDLTFSSDPTALGVLTLTTPTALAYGGAPLNPLVSSIFQSFTVTFAGPSTFSGNIFSQLTFDASHNLIGLDASSTVNGETLLIGKKSFSGAFGTVFSTTVPGSSYELFNTTAGSGAINSLTITQVASAPEPSTWALVLTGFGLTGAALRRRSGQRVRA